MVLVEIKKRQKIIQPVSQLLSSLLFMLIVCGANGVSDKNKMAIPELGVSINIPKGWQLDNPQMCHQGDNTGLLMEEELEGLPFRTATLQMSKEFGNTVISENPLIIDGHKAIKVVADTSAGDRLIRIYINKGEKMVVISFVILKDEYPANKSRVEKSIKSIKIK